MQKLKAFLQGFLECRGDMGLTWNNDPYHPLSVAYDRGRTLGQTLFNCN